MAIQEARRGFQPSKLGCMYTMPHRLTVAGEATARSATSKIMFMRPDMAMISPLFKHNFLLSSSTCSQQHALNGEASSRRGRASDGVLMLEQYGLYSSTVKLHMRLIADGNASAILLNI